MKSASATRKAVIQGAWGVDVNGPPCVDAGECRDRDEEKMRVMVA